MSWVTTTFQVQKWPPGNFNNDADRAEIRHRKPITVGNANVVREKVSAVDLVGAELWQQGSSASYRKEETNSRLSVVGGTPEYPENNTHYVDLGRNITNEDVALQRNVAVIGFSIAEHLFPFIDPIDKIIKVDGLKVQGRGSFRREDVGPGRQLRQLCPDSGVPLREGLRKRLGDGTLRSVNMTVRAKSPELLLAAIEETRAVLRIDRGVPPGAEDDFYYYTNDSMIKQFNEATAGVKLGAFVIGTIALDGGRHRYQEHHAGERY